MDYIISGIGSVLAFGIKLVAVGGIAVGLFAYTTKPNEQSFDHFFNSVSNLPKIGNKLLFQTIVSKKFSDWIFFKTVELQFSGKSNKIYYIGAFNNWFGEKNKLDF